MPHLLLPTSGSCEQCIFSLEGCTSYSEVFFRIYSPLALEVYKIQFIDSLDSVAVDEIRKDLFGLTL